MLPLLINSFSESTLASYFVLQRNTYTIFSFLLSLNMKCWKGISFLTSTIHSNTYSSFRLLIILWANTWFTLNIVMNYARKRYKTWNINKRFWSCWNCGKLILCRCFQISPWLYFLKLTPTLITEIKLFLVSSLLTLRQTKAFCCGKPWSIVNHKAMLLSTSATLSSNLNNCPSIDISC